jgi:hypothetical protein
MDGMDGWCNLVGFGMEEILCIWIWPDWMILDG